MIETIDKGGQEPAPQNPTSDVGAGFKPARARIALSADTAAGSLTE